MWRAPAERQVSYSNVKPLRQLTNLIAPLTKQLPAPPTRFTATPKPQSLQNQRSQKADAACFLKYIIRISQLYRTPTPIPFKTLIPIKPGKNPLRNPKPPRPKYPSRQARHAEVFNIFLARHCDKNPPWTKDRLRIKQSPSTLTANDS